MIFEDRFRVKKAKVFNRGETIIENSLLQIICKYEVVWFHLNQLLCCCFMLLLLKGFFYCNKEVREKLTAYETTLDDYSLLILSQGLFWK